MPAPYFDKAATFAQWPAEILRDSSSAKNPVRFVQADMRVMLPKHSGHCSQLLKPSSLFNLRSSIIGLLLALLCLPWLGNAQELKPKPPEWKIKGALAAFADADPRVRAIALDTLRQLEALHHIPAHKIAELLKDSEPAVRSAAVRALGSMGETAKEHMPQIAELLKDSNHDIRFAAVEALGDLGEGTKEYVIQIADLLKYESPAIRSAAARALGNIGEAAKEQAPRIADLLSDKDEDVRSAAAEALGRMGEDIKGHTQKTVELLKDLDYYVRSDAAEALGNMGEAAKEQVPEIAELLKDPHPYVRFAAANALGSMGEVAKEQASEIAELLKDSHSYVRFAAAHALGNMSEAAKIYMPQIAELLNDPDTDSRSAAARALGNMGEAAKVYMPPIANLLKDQYARSAAIEALGNMGEVAKKYAPKIAELLKDQEMSLSIAAIEALRNKERVPTIGELLKAQDRNIHDVATQALMNMGETASEYSLTIAELLNNDYYEPDRSTVDEGSYYTGPLDIKSILTILNPVYYDTSRVSELRFLAHLVGGGNDTTETLLKWLGKPIAYPEAISYEEGVKTLRAFVQAWEPSASLPGLRKDLAEQIAVVAQMGSWKAEDFALLQRHANNLKAANSTHAAAVDNVIAVMGRRNWLFDISKIWLAHALFWLLLIFAYPKSPQIQAIFFWNAWVRRLTGLGYVGFALTWVPYLRAKLFAPFKESLLSDAALESFDARAYFAASAVKLKISGQTLPIAEAIPEIKGQIVLEGESGLGKTMFLRHLVQRAARIVVYLPAEKCAKGVIEAIQAKLHGQAQDADFLRNLIYSSAIDIIIDGLNEVTADTRAKITAFVESYFKGNIIMAAQPLEWTPPVTAKIHIMQPLSPDQIERFLLTRQPNLAESTPFPSEVRSPGPLWADDRARINAPQGGKATADYEQACKRYLAEALDENQPSEILASAQRILSNPMDLTVVAQMLAAGQPPDLFHLQAQQHRLVAEDYQRVNNSAFPLRSFSEEIYEMRLADRLALPEEKFFKELQRMEQHKMVVSRQSLDAQGKPTKEWYFRHDKIMEFFIVQTFLGENNDRPQKHLGDPRFRGVYFLLAILLPLEAATALREHLIQYAADTKDHTVSDTFIQLLRARKLG